jgi:GTPase SAR1 family protein
VFVFDLTDSNSFFNLSNWIEDVNKLTTDNPIKLVLANKSDLEDRAVSKSEIDEFSRKTGIEVIECSAKNSYHINYAFETMSNILLKRR